MDGPSAFAYGKHATGMGGFCFDFASEESSEGMQSVKNRKEHSSHFWKSLPS
jgi:hypothetical protein